MADVWSAGCCTCSSFSGYVTLNCAVHRNVRSAPPKKQPPAICGVREIADMLGVSRSRSHRIIGSYPDFPEPLADLTIGRVWLVSDVEHWIARHPHRPTGRPKK